jgi:hypothetical protein
LGENFAYPFLANPFAKMNKITRVARKFMLKKHT